MPPLDKEKGETLLSPLVMCGPHGLKFKKPVELLLPHRASLNGQISFKTKTSPDLSTGTSRDGPEWRNMTLVAVDGVSQGRVDNNTVSVMVDHF